MSLLVVMSFHGLQEPLYVDKHVLDVATASAIIAYNDGLQGLYPVIRSLVIKPGYYGYLISEKQDHTRINKSNTQSADESKEGRKKFGTFHKRKCILPSMRPVTVRIISKNVSILSKQAIISKLFY